MTDEHITDTDLGGGVTLRELDLPAIVAERTGTSAGDWQEIDGPDSGVGLTYWYGHKGNGWQAYVTVDQDDVEVSVTDEDGDAVDASGGEG